MRTEIQYGIIRSHTATNSNNNKSNTRTTTAENILSLIRASFIPTSFLST